MLNRKRNSPGPKLHAHQQPSVRTPNEQEGMELRSLATLRKPLCSFLFFWRGRIILLNHQSGGEPTSVQIQLLGSHCFSSNSFPTGLQLLFKGIALTQRLPAEDRRAPYRHLKWKTTFFFFFFFPPSLPMGWHFCWLNYTYLNKSKFRHLPLHGVSCEK